MKSKFSLPINRRFKLYLVTVFLMMNFEWMNFE